MISFHKIWALLIPFLFIQFAGYGQDNYEIQVYGAELIPENITMVELHSNYTAMGSTMVTDGVRPTQGAVHETVEITHGFTPWFEIGFYYFSSYNPHYGYGWVGDHIRPRISVPESMNWPVGLSLSSEFGYQKPEYSSDEITLEFRPIVDKKINRLYLAINPVLDYSFKGENAGKSGIFSTDFKISYDITKAIAFGFEYYGAFGPLSGLSAYEQQQHQIFPAIDLNLSPEWEFNFGVGKGFTTATDGLIFKIILGRRLGGNKGHKIKNEY